MASIAIEIDKDKLRDFCRRWKITEFAFFGSVVRPEEFRQDSDVDVLVRFAPDAHTTLFDMAGMEEELEELFGRRVDLVSWRGVERTANELRRHSILDSAVVLDVA